MNQRPKPRLQRTPLRAPQSRKPVGVRTPDPNDADHGKDHLLWRRSRVCCSLEAFIGHSAALTL
jgi:hypothetical protein